MGMSDNYTSIKQSDKDEIFDNEEFDILVDNVSAEIENILRNKKAPTSYGDDVTERELVERIYKTFDFVKIDSVETHGKQAVAYVILKQNKLDKEITLELEMTQLSDGTWEIMSLANAEDIGEELYEIAQAKLAEINKPTQEAIDAAVKIGEVKPTLRRMGRNAYSPLYTYLQVNIAVTVGEKSVSTIEGDIVFEGIGSNKNEVLRVPAVLKNTNIAMTNTTRTYYYSDRLVEDSDMYEKLRAANMNNFNDVKMSFKVKRVEFADGTELALKTKMNDAEAF